MQRKGKSNERTYHYDAWGLGIFGVGHHLRGGLIREILGEVLAVAGLCPIILGGMIGISYIILRDKEMAGIARFTSYMVFVSGYFLARVFGYMERKF